VTAPAHTNAAWVGLLTPREAEVLELVALGMTGPQIARELWVTEQTVKFHVGNVYLKLGLRTVGAHEPRDGSARVRAARWWWENVEAHDGPR
jgi:DNA-binding NarL/FixJ family response regulator